VAEKAEGETGWLFPVGDEIHELGYRHMFADVLDAMEKGSVPMETLYDGYVVNAVMDACYHSVRTKRWEPVVLDGWRGTGCKSVEDGAGDGSAEFILLKEEKMPDGRMKKILKEMATGKIIQRID